MGRGRALGEEWLPSAEVFLPGNEGVNTSARPTSPLGVGLYPGAATFLSPDFGYRRLNSLGLFPNLYSGNINSPSHRIVELPRGLNATKREKRLTLCRAQGIQRSHCNEN